MIGEAAGRRAWVLNLEAEAELEDPARRTPSEATRARITALRGRLGGLVRDEDLVVDDRSPPGIARGLRGVAWCPTPGALSLLRRAGATPPEAPSRGVLRLVNHRAFCAGLGQTLPGARQASTAAEVEAVILGPSPTGQWLLKRALGFTGRGRLRVAVGPLDEASRRWVTASLRRGDALQVEPLVERRGDFAIHGWITASAALTLGEPTTLRCSDDGAWVGSERDAGELSGAERAALEAEARRVAEALSREGYHGPFNLDAFRWRDPATGTTVLNPRCEINARFSMGWAVGMGAHL
jgi:hypothetical protein